MNDDPQPVKRPSSFSLTAKRNCSISLRDCLRLPAVMVLLCLGIVIAFTSFGRG